MIETRSEKILFYRMLQRQQIKRFLLLVFAHQRNMKFVFIVFMNEPINHLIKENVLELRQLYVYLFLISDKFILLFTNRYILWMAFYIGACTCSYRIELDFSQCHIISSNQT